ncbi:PRC-barrel domain containing protein [Streptomyces sp. SID13666]|uniref:PRC-barrel domain-containing protein n=1 Tax=unclassified Streptomyces TaxID=2593676 RepID=UPI0013C084BF|nr:PRC-barrel domain containing protein [Streptomyces sp. SID13666]NEA71782.1 PRC-barrel domain containing protein [Streptomyces sp. SID13588]
MTDSMWGYQAASGHQAGTDLTGFKVEATNGSIGKVDKHSDEVSAAYIVVDTGVWIFGKHVLLPAGTIQSIDIAERKIYVARDKDEIKNAPEFDKDKHTGHSGYHQQVEAYYATHRA